MTSHSRLYLLRSDRIALVLDEHRLRHADIANELGLSRQYWSLLFGRKRPLSVRVRRLLLSNVRLRGIPESELWEIRNSGDGAPRHP